MAPCQPTVQRRAVLALAEACPATALRREALALEEQRLAMERHPVAAVATATVRHFRLPIGRRTAVAANCTEDKLYKVSEEAFFSLSFSLTALPLKYQLWETLTGETSESNI